jgi:threonine dehydrogenase-like Zn-dependent dehydrogenase
VRAFVITAPGVGAVQEVADPVPRAGEVVVRVERAGVCGTDAELFSGEMAYLRTGDAAYPLRIGHEWCGVVDELGPGVPAGWLGTRVTGETMLGCGHCRRCAAGRAYLCADRHEIGIRRGWPGALAQRLPVPVTALHQLPDAVDAAAGAMVEPGGNALRAVQATRGDRVLILGPGTIGLLAALFATAAGTEVHLLAPDGPAGDFARGLGFTRVWTRDTLPRIRYDSVLDASNAADLPALAADLVEPGGRTVYIGLSERPSPLDTRTLVLKDVTAVGILSASGAFPRTIAAYADGTVDPRPLIAATLPLDRTAAALTGPRTGPAPKIHINPSG